MESLPNNYFETTYDLAKKYIDDRIILLKIQSAKKLAKLASNIIYILISTILLFFIFMFVGLMLAYYFSEKFNSNFYGFSLVAGIYLIIFLIFTLTYKNYFSHKIKDMVATVFFENDSLDIDDEDEDY